MRHTTAIHVPALLLEPAVPGRPVRERMLRVLLEAVAPLSAGIQIGLRHGFDSGIMQDYACRNNAEGVSVLGRWVDRWYLNHFRWPELRARTHLLRESLRGLLSMRRGGEAPTRLVALGGAPARYLIELLGDSCGARLECRVLDPDPVSLAEGRRIARVLERTGIEYERRDAIDPGTLASGVSSPDIIVASGLFERMRSDGEVRQMMARIHGALAPGGHMVYTTGSAWPADAALPACTAGMASLRDSSAVEVWVRAAGFDGVRCETDPEGEFAVCVATK